MPALSYGEERAHGPSSLMDAPVRHAATYSRRRSGKLPSRTTMKGILLGTSTCATSNRSGLTRVGTHAWESRTARARTALHCWLDYCVAGAVGTRFKSATP